MNHRASEVRFALLGAAGYVAPRHLEAMKQLRGSLLCAMDPHDSVGILDRFSSRAQFFLNFEDFEHFLRKLRDQGQPIDYVSICSPNDLHAHHAQRVLHSRSNAICEKPLVLRPDELDPLLELCAKTGQAIHPVLQLREHSNLRALKTQIGDSTSSIHEIDLTYITARGPWYFSSWKGHQKRSGGLISSIGIHFLDMLLWIFGAAEKCDVHWRTKTTIAGTLELERARVRWFLSIDEACLPERIRRAQKTVYRSIRVDGSELEFSDPGENLHVEVYRQILKGNGLSPQDARPALELTHQLQQIDTSTAIPSWLTRVPA